MASVNEKLPSPTKSEGSPTNSIRILKTPSTDDTQVKVELTPNGDTSVTIEISKGNKVKDVIKEEENGKQDDKNEVHEVKPITDEEVEKICSKFKSMGKEEMKRCMDFFWSIDTFRFGAFTVHQLANRLRFTGYYFSNKQIAKMFSDLDQDGDMVVSLEEFLSDMGKPKREPPSKDSLKQWFDRFDRDGDGYVTRDDVIKMCEQNGSFILSTQLEEIMQHDRSGRRERLTFEDFCNAVKRS